MDYGNSDTSTTSLGVNQFPISEVYVPSGTQTAAAGGTLTALEGGPASTDSASPAKRSAPASMYVKDGSDVAQGTTTDVAVTGDNPGTQAAKLRGLAKILADIWDSVNHRIKVDGSAVTQPASIADGSSTTLGAKTDTAITDSTTTNSQMSFTKGFVKILADVWDSTNHWLQVKVMNGNTNGQAVMAGSSPVALASNQPGLSQMASQDGLTPTAVLAEGMYIYSAGGPVDSTGKAQQASLDRVKSLQGAGLVGSTGNITTTVAGDVNLVFGTAPKTIMPGQKIQLSVGTAAPVETVIVSSSYVPSSTATTIPLQFPVVNASSTSAKWDQYVPAGVQGATGILPIDIPLYAQVIQDATANSSVYYLPANAGADGGSVLKFLEHAIGLYNGTNLDRQRGNLDNISLVASAAYTTTQTGTDQTNYNGRGVIVTLDVTAGTTPSLTLEIDGKDPVSGKYFSLLTASATVAATGTFIYMVYPGASTTVTNTGVTQSSGMVLPRTWRAKIVAGNANSITYSAGASIIV